nr:2-dehydropantoate 2-reductase N-terminal domain-containing protein [uncultured Eisenbergiella sp.]
MNQKKRILVYGAGVIGSYLAHVLCTAGNEVSLLARGERKKELEKRGLVIRHYLQKKTTRDYPLIVEAPDPALEYDAVFAVMQWQQMYGILDQLAAVASPLVILVGNNLSAAAMEDYIRRNSSRPKKIMFGFQGTGGRRVKEEVVCVRFGKGGMNIGSLHEKPDRALSETIAGFFRGSGYRLTYSSDMDSWYKCHAAFILPIAFVCYSVDCELKRASAGQLKQLMEAVGEAYGMLEASGCSIQPEGDEAYFKKGPKKLLLYLLLKIMAKTAAGKLAASDHCRSAPAEIQALDMEFQKLWAQAGVRPGPAWQALEDGLPGWDVIRRRYNSRL